MNLLDLIPGGRLGQIIVAAVLAALVIGGVSYGVHSYNEGLREDGRQEVRAEWAADREKQKDQAIADAAANAKETFRRLDRQGEAQRENAVELARYKRAAADADDARRGMQLDIDNLAAVAQRATGDSATGDQRKAGAAAAGMLADVSRGSDALAELFARTADTSRRAGVLCERSYDALMPPKGPL